MARMFGTDGVRGVAGGEPTIEPSDGMRLDQNLRSSLRQNLDRRELMCLRKSRNIRQRLSLAVIREFQEECLQVH